MVALTELDKTVLLAFLVSSKKKKDKFQLVEPIVLKFPMRQRRSVRRSINKLEEGDFLARRGKQNSYRLSEKGLRSSLKLLSEGAKLWAYFK